MSRRVSESKLRALNRALLTYEKMAAITVVGIIFVVGLLSDRLMMIKVEEFIGIRLAIITPLILVVLHEALGLSSLHTFDGWAKRKSLIKDKWQEISGSPVKLGQIVCGILGLAVLGYIIMRTGNDPGLAVSGSEKSIRAATEQVALCAAPFKGVYVRISFDDDWIVPLLLRLAPMVSSLRLRRRDCSS